MRVGGPPIMQPTTPMKAWTHSLATSPPALPTVTPLPSTQPPTRTHFHRIPLDHYKPPCRSAKQQPLLPLRTTRFVTNWISYQRTKTFPEISSARDSCRIGRTTLPAPTSATLMRCKRRILLPHKYGSFTPRLRLNYPSRSEWRTYHGE